MPQSQADVASLQLFAVLFAAWAAWVDLRARRIPNALVASGIVAALMLQGWVHGIAGLAAAAAGIALGLGLMVPFYALGAMGAGDAKLMAMVGAFVGAKGVLAAAVLTFLVGGVLSLGVAFARGTLGRLLSNVRAMLYRIFSPMAVRSKAEIDEPAVSAGRLPYAVAIAVGTLLYSLLLYQGIHVI